MSLIIEKSAGCWSFRSGEWGVKGDIPHACRSRFQLNVAKCRRKKAPHFRAGLLHLFNAWQFPTLAWGDPTLPSALRRFTSEFGMGSGGTTALKPPGKFFVLCPVSFVLMLRWPPSRYSVTYFSMLLRIARLPPCLSAKSFGLQSAGHNCIRLTS